MLSVQEGNPQRQWSLSRTSPHQPARKKWFPEHNWSLPFMQPACQRCIWLGCLSAEPVNVWCNYNLEEIELFLFHFLFRCTWAATVAQSEAWLLNQPLTLSAAWDKKCIVHLCLVQMWDKLQSALLVRVSDVKSPRIICIYPSCHWPDYKFGGLGFTFHLLLIIL